jgi:hypothetical protein
VLDLLLQEDLLVLVAKLDLGIDRLLERVDRDGEAL